MSAKTSAVTTAESFGLVLAAAVVTGVGTYLVTSDAFSTWLSPNELSEKMRSGLYSFVDIVRDSHRGPQPSGNIVHDSTENARIGESGNSLRNSLVFDHTSASLQMINESDREPETQMGLRSQVAIPGRQRNGGMHTVSRERALDIKALEAAVSMDALAALTTSPNVALRRGALRMLIDRAAEPEELAHIIAIVKNPTTVLNEEATESEIEAERLRAVTTLATIAQNREFAHRLSKSGALTAFLECTRPGNDRKIQVKALQAIYDICRRHDERKKRLVRKGILAHLNSILNTSTSRNLLLYTIRVLHEICLLLDGSFQQSFREGLKSSVVRSGCLRGVIRALHLGHSEGEINRFSMHIIWLLTNGDNDVDSLRDCVRAGLVSRAVRCLRYDDAELQYLSLLILHDMSLKDVGNDEMRKQPFIVKILASLLAVGEANSQKVILRTIGILAINCNDFKLQVIESRLLRALTPCLLSQDSDVSHWAIVLAHDLAMYGQRAVTALVEVEGLIEALITVGANTEALPARFVAETMGFICACEKYHQLVVDNGGLTTIAYFARSSDEELKFWAVALLLNLSMTSDDLKQRIIEDATGDLLLQVVLQRVGKQVPQMAAKTMVILGLVCSSWEHRVQKQIIDPLIDRVYMQSSPESSRRVEEMQLLGICARSNGHKEYLAQSMMLYVALRGATELHWLRKGIHRDIGEGHLADLQRGVAAVQLLSALCAHEQSCVYVARDFSLQYHLCEVWERVLDALDQRECLDEESEDEMDDGEPPFPEPGVDQEQVRMYGSMERPSNAFGRERVSDYVDFSPFESENSMGIPSNVPGELQFVSRRARLRQSPDDGRLFDRSEIGEGSPLGDLPSPLLNRDTSVGTEDLRPTPTGDEMGDAEKIEGVIRDLVSMSEGICITLALCCIHGWPAEERNSPRGKFILQKVWHLALRQTTVCISFYVNLALTVSLVRQDFAGSDAQQNLPQDLIEIMNAEHPRHDTLSSGHMGGLGPPNFPLVDSTKTADLQCSYDFRELRNDSWTFESCRTNVGVSSANPGQWYFEVQVRTRGIMQIGICTDECLFKPERGIGVGDDDHSYSFDGSRCSIWHGTNNAAWKEGYGTPWLADDVIGCLLNTKTGTLGFFQNGRWLGYAFTDINMSKDWFPAFSLSSDQHCEVSFSEHDLRYKLPADAKALTWLYGKAKDKAPVQPDRESADGTEKEMTKMDDTNVLLMPRLNRMSSVWPVRETEVSSPLPEAMGISPSSSPALEEGEERERDDLPDNDNVQDMVNSPSLRYSISKAVPQAYIEVLASPSLQMLGICVNRGDLFIASIVPGTRDFLLRICRYGVSDTEELYAEPFSPLASGGEEDISCIGVGCNVATGVAQVVFTLDGDTVVKSDLSDSSESLVVDLLARGRSPSINFGLGRSFMYAEANQPDFIEHLSANINKQAIICRKTTELDSSIAGTGLSPLKPSSQPASATDDAPSAVRTEVHSDDEDGGVSPRSRIKFNRSHSVR
eukprot:Clim_evm17s253 gene=Clim_evmTU17s253